MIAVNSSGGVNPCFLMMSPGVAMTTHVQSATQGLFRPVLFFPLPKVMTIRCQRCRDGLLAEVFFDALDWNWRVPGWLVRPDPPPGHLRVGHPVQLACRIFAVGFPEALQEGSVFRA